MLGLSADDDGQPIAIGHLSDSGDLNIHKIFLKCTWFLKKYRSLNPDLTVKENYDDICYCTELNEFSKEKVMQEYICILKKNSQTRYKIKLKVKLIKGLDFSPHSKIGGV